MTAENLTRASFGGSLFNPEVTAKIIGLGLAGAPLFAAMTRRTTNKSSVVFGTAAPTGFDWVPEAGLIPGIDLASDKLIVAPSKLAGILSLSNESLSDSEFNLTNELGRLIAASMAPAVDSGILYGDPVGGNPASPTGFFDAIDEVEKSTLRSAVVGACAEMMGAGGTPTHVFLTAEMWAAELDRRETVVGGSGPILADLGLDLKVGICPSLTTGNGLVIDAAGCFGIVRTDFSIDSTDQADAAFKYDSTLLRVKARLAAAIPDPDRSARSIAVTAPSGT